MSSTQGSLSQATDGFPNISSVIPTAPDGAIAAYCERDSDERDADTVSYDGSDVSTIRPGGRRGASDADSSFSFRPSQPTIPEVPNDGPSNTGRRAQASATPPAYTNSIAATNPQTHIPGVGATVAAFGGVHAFPFVPFQGGTAAPPQYTAGMYMHLNIPFGYTPISPTLI